jgi:hypothetical protein
VELQFIHTVFPRRGLDLSTHLSVQNWIDSQTHLAITYSGFICFDTHRYIQLIYLL